MMETEDLNVYLLPLSVVGLSLAAGALDPTLSLQTMLPVGLLALVMGHLALTAYRELQDAPDYRSE